MENLLQRPREMKFTKCTKFSSYMEKMEAENGILLNCLDEGKERRRKMHCLPVFNWLARKRCVQHKDLGEEKKC